MNQGYGVGARELLFGLLLLAIYFLPTIMAMRSSHRNATSIVLLNIFAGWLVVPWIIALIWSFQSPR